MVLTSAEELALEAPCTLGVVVVNQTPTVSRRGRASFTLSTTFEIRDHHLAYLRQRVGYYRQIESIAKLDSCTVEVVFTREAGQVRLLEAMTVCARNFRRDWVKFIDDHPQGSQQPAQPVQKQQPKKSRKERTDTRDADRKSSPINTGMGVTFSNRANNGR